jgi:putative nucleotidyltransferase with HDIG domain
MSGQYSYLKKIQVKTDSLRIGMYVSELDKPWQDSSFAFQGFPINTTEELETLREECNWVFVDFPSDKAYQVYLQSIAASDDEVKKNNSPANDLDSLRQELPRAKENFEKSSRMVKNIMQSIIRDEEFELEPVQKAVEECVDSILHNPDALILLSNIKNADEYTAEHCLRVAIMSIAFSKFLGLNIEELYAVGIGAMLHDVGKMRVPGAILNKPGKLSPAEYDIMKDHAVEGFNILKDKKLLSAGVIDIAYSHHERVDGEGYPRKLLAHQISRYAKIVSIVDTFDAVTSERVYSPAQSPSHAFKVLLDNADKQFDATLAEKFVEWMGVYPVGSIVEMQTGELGLVIKVHYEKKLKPRVLLVTDEEKQKGYQKVVDLARMSVHSSGRAYQIKTVHANGSFDIDLKEFVDNGLLLHR